MQAGRITVDGVDIRDIGSRGRCARCSGSSCRTSICSPGRSAATCGSATTSISDDDVRRALDAVHASSFVDRLPQASTPWSPSVARRSLSGQKQLLSFARALAFDPRVLILDEATSSVDTDTELLIRDALKVVMRGRTTIAIAHRLSTIQDMDRILVLHQGELREAGTHQELLALRGIYHRLYELQFDSTTA